MVLSLRLLQSLGLMNKIQRFVIFMKQWKQFCRDRSDHRRKDREDRKQTINLNAISKIQRFVIFMKQFCRDCSDHRRKDREGRKQTVNLNAISKDFNGKICNADLRYQEKKASSIFLQLWTKLPSLPALPKITSLKGYILL